MAAHAAQSRGQKLKQAHGGTGWSNFEDEQEVKSEVALLAPCKARMHVDLICNAKVAKGLKK